MPRWTLFLLQKWAKSDYFIHRFFKSNTISFKIGFNKNAKTVLATPTISTWSKLGLTSSCSSKKLVALQRVSSMMSLSCSNLWTVMWGRRREELKLARISRVSSEGLNWFFKAKALTSSSGNGDRILCRDWNKLYVYSDLLLHVQGLFWYVKNFFPPIKIGKTIDTNWNIFYILTLP